LMAHSGRTYCGIEIKSASFRRSEKTLTDKCKRKGGGLKL
jgi:hypothetical protein